MALSATPLPKAPPAFHQKRQGTHRPHTKHFTKTYWPYLPMLLIVFLGVIINAAWNHPRSVLGAAVDVSPTALLVSTNAERQAVHTSKLTLNAALNRAAQAKAEDMAKRDYWAHVSPTGKQPWSFISETGYTYQQAGENLAYGFDSAPTVISGWMHSPEHRSTMLAHNYQEVGFGVIQSPSYQHHGPTTIVVALYATPSPSVLSATTSKATAGASTSAAASSQPIVRAQLFGTSMSNWPLIVLYAAGSIAGIVWCLRHRRILQRVLTRGEAIVVRHKWADVVVLLVAIASIVLTRPAGFIH